MVKSKFFLKNQFPSEEFDRDFKGALDLNPEMFDHFARLTSKYILARTHGATHLLLDDFRTEHELSPAVLKRTLALCSFILRNLNLADTPEQLSEDVIELLGLPQEQKSVVIAFFDALIKEHKEQFLDKWRARMASLSGSQYIENISTSAEARAVPFSSTVIRS